jgi:tetratricopeptide (TPR) repeat protein
MPPEAPKKFAILSLLIALCGTALGGQSPRLRDINGKRSRIQALLVHLADQARTSDDLVFSVQAQVRAATLLWPYESDRARAMFRQAFDSLGTGDGERGESSKQRGLATTQTRLQLRAELLNQVAARDPELVEELARKLVLPLDSGRDGGVGDTDGTPAPGRLDVAKRELFVTVALQIVELDPNRAMTLGQLSLGAGLDEVSPFLSPNFSRLLMLLGGVDRELARLLFSSAVDRIERSPSCALADLEILSSYLASQGNSASVSVGKKETERFLRFAFSRIMRYRERPSVEAAGQGSGAPRLDDKSAIYFIGRQLTEFFARYFPERLPQLKSRIADLTDASAPERLVESTPFEALGPSDVARLARETSEAPERDALYARAALSWLAQGETAEAQAAAQKIASVVTRDRVLTQIARRRTTEGRIEEAVAIARRIEDRNTRFSVLVTAALESLARHDRTRAAELLTETENEALKAEPSPERAQTLLAVANSFASFDMVRAFEVMQSAIKGLNQVLLAADSSSPPPVNDNLYRRGLEGTLSSLARSDFDRALLLAQQLNSKDASIIAQLAVCGGGLSVEPKHESAESDGLGEAPNPR